MWESSDDLEKLEGFWYSLLREEGFQDIEDTTLSHRPLKAWHSFHFPTERVQLRRETREKYQSLIEDFMHRDDLGEIATLSTNHSNTPLTTDDALLILTLHSQGFTERAIAVKVGRSKTCIHQMLERFRSWMKLL